MSESLLGVSVAATRQNSGSVLNGFAAFGRSAGWVNCPAGTSSAFVTLTFLSASDASVSQVAADAGVAPRQTIDAIAPVIAKLFIFASAARSIPTRPDKQKGQPRRAALFCLATLATGAVYEVFFSWATSASSMRVYSASLVSKAFVYSCSEILALPQSPSKATLLPPVSTVSYG